MDIYDDFLDEIIVSLSEHGDNDTDISSQVIRNRHNVCEFAGSSSLI